MSITMKTKQITTTSMLTMMIHGKAWHISCASITITTIIITITTIIMTVITTTTMTTTLVIKIIQKPVRPALVGICWHATKTTAKQLVGARGVYYARPDI